MLLGIGTCLFYMAIPTINSYFCVHVLHNESLVGTVNAAYITPMIIFFFLMASIVKKIGKMNTNLVGWAAILISYIPLFFGMENVTFVNGTSVIRGIGYACVMGYNLQLLAIV